MKCHYEVLEVPRDAEGAEIKAAYRKFALKWHPDKNLDNVEAAKEQFQLVQQAYEVLSNPMERAWYDKHRDQILRPKSDFEDACLNVFPFCTPSCFKGYKDDERGFYAVYAKVFEDIIKEDLEFMEDQEEFTEIPRFGNSKSDYGTVVGPFYTHWMSYNTKKTYSWLYPHDVTDMQNRRVVKLMDKENKKVRQQAQKERNGEVRNLVEFVRMHDPRVKHQLKLRKQQNIENKQKLEQLRLQKMKERKEALAGEQSEWMKFHNVQSQLEEIEKNISKEFGDQSDDDSEDKDDAEKIEMIYCPACGKYYNNPKAFGNHTNSKKHNERMVAMFLQETNGKEEGEEGDDDCSDLEEDFEMLEKENDELTDEDSKTEECDIEEEDDMLIDKKKEKKKNKKPKNVMKVEETPLEETPVQLEGISDDVFFSSLKKQKKAARKTNKAKTETTVSEIPESATNGNDVQEQQKTKKKQGKKEADDGEKIDTSHCCVTCKAQFPSKNKLFDHLKKTGHGVPIPIKVIGNVATKTRKGGRQRN